MNADKLKELKERAERATQLAEEIEALQSANRFSHYLRFSKSYGDSSEILPKSLLGELFDLGKAQLIEQKEAKLAALLGVSQTVVAYEIEPVTAQGVWHNADSSDTWEQPAQIG